MNISFNSNIKKGGTSKKLSHVPYSHPVLHNFDNNPEKRPLNHNSQNLSFKGLSYKMVVNKNTKKAIEFNTDEILKIAKKHLGSSAQTLFDSVIDSHLSTAKNMVLFDKAKKTVKFQEKTVFSLIYDGIVYPFKVLPGDILNGTVEFLGKIKPFKKWAEKTYNSDFLRNIRQKSKIESKVNSLRGLFETIAENKDNEEVISSKLFQRSVKMFDPESGNYDTKHERSLNRIVSGSVPAFFLANDAYNLAMMSSKQKDPSIQTEDAKKEARTRFKQELSRVGLNAYIQLITLGALQKQINNSQLGVMLNIGLTVLFTEAFARLSNGKYITKLTPEKAKEINATNNEKNNTQTNDKSEDKTKETGSIQKPQKPAAFSGTKINKPEKTAEQKKQEPLLSFNTIMKASAAVIAAGFGIRGLRKIKSVDNLFTSTIKSFENLYKKITVDSDNKISKAEFNKIIETFKKNGFETLANKYEEVAKIANPINIAKLLKQDNPKIYDKLFKDYGKKANEINYVDFLKHILKSKDTEAQSMVTKLNSLLNDDHIHLGEKAKKHAPFIKFAVTPFNALYRAITFPFTIVNKIIKACQKAPKKAGKSMDQISAEALAQSIDKMQKATGLGEEKFKSFVNDSISKSFNVNTMSSIPNHELSNLAKTAATISTLWFLMTDNYNMVMLKSNGEDKQGAEEKFKGRFVQEMSRLFYQTLLIDLFNKTFKSQYNGSLIGMSWVTLSNTFLGEILTRKSIGVPVERHSKEELVDIQTKQENATGFTKTYYNFMSRLTGKKSLAERKNDK